MLMQKWAFQPWRLLVLGGSLLLLLAAILWLVTAAEAQIDREEPLLLEQNIRQMVAQSYALKGRYPPSLSYLAENYGLRIDQQRFIVHYQFIADNLPPKIRVFTIE